MRHCILIFFITITHIGLACTCKKLAPFNQEEFNETDYIFLGTVDSQFYDTIANKRSFYTRFKIIKQYKGKFIENYINIRNSSFCRAYFTIGTHYLLFIGLDNKVPIISKCHRKIQVEKPSKFKTPPWLKRYINQENGFHKYFLPSGELEAKGTIINQTPHGFWTYYHSDGTTIKSSGKYKNGKRDSTWVYYDKNLAKSIVNYAEGIRHGKVLGYNSSKHLVYSENYFDGEKHDTCLAYYDSGKLQSLETYEYGKQLTTETYYNNGNQKQLKTDSANLEMYWFENGVMAMKKYTFNHIRYYTRYWPTGEIVLDQFTKNKIDYVITASNENKVITVVNGNGFYHYGGQKGQYKDSLKTGLWTVNINNGDVHKTYYKHGLKDSVSTIFNRNGILLMSNTYQNGIQTGILKRYYTNGQIKSETILKDDQYLLINFWTINGTQTVIEGNGFIEDYDENGKKQSWSTRQVYQNGLLKR